MQEFFLLGLFLYVQHGNKNILANLLWMFLLYDKKARIHLEIITLVFVRSPFCSILHLLLMIFIMFDPVDNKIILESIIINFF